MDRIGRHPERSRPDRAELDAVLDATSTGTLATVVDGLPWAVPMLYARDGDRVLLHGSTGAGALRHVAAGAPAAFCVSLIDGIVVAETLFDSSANYRSAVVRGVLTTLTDAEAARAMTVLSDHLLPGRSAEVPDHTRKELAATLAVALPIEPGQWTVKVRDAPPGQPDEPGADWTGVVPLRTVADQPVAAPWIPAGAPVPESVRRFVAAHPSQPDPPVT